MAKSLVGQPPSELTAGPPRLSFPRISLRPNLSQLPPQRLDLGVKFAGIHRQLDALVLDLGQLKPQLGVLGRRGEEEGIDGDGWPPWRHRSPDATRRLRNRVEAAGWLARSLDRASCCRESA